MSLREERGFPGYELSHFKVEGWAREEIGRFILFWEKHENGNGFECVVIEWVTECDGITYYEEVLRATAYFDGVRHLHFRQGGDEPDFCGYDCYPHMSSYVLLFKRLRELELEHCRDADK